MKIDIRKRSKTARGNVVKQTVQYLNYEVDIIHIAMYHCLKPVNCHAK